MFEKSTEARRARIPNFRWTLQKKLLEIYLSEMYKVGTETIDADTLQLWRGSSSVRSSGDKKQFGQIRYPQTNLDKKKPK